MKPEIEEFARLIVREVRDESIRSCDRQCQSGECYGVALRWRDHLGGASPSELARSIIMDCIDEALFCLLNAIDTGVLHLSYVASNGNVVDLTDDGMGELAGWYVLGKEGWRARYSEERFVEDSADGGRTDVELISRIIALADKECGPGATREEITTAERGLGVSFPESYRQFLIGFGWARFSRHLIYGVCRNTPLYADVVRNTTALRSLMEPALPRHLIPIMNDGRGNHYCLDTSGTTNGECAVVFWDHEKPADQIAGQVAVAFDIWLLDLIRELSDA
jgi:hypothetical protein